MIIIDIENTFSLKKNDDVEEYTFYKTFIKTRNSLRPPFYLTNEITEPGVVETKKDVTIVSEQNAQGAYVDYAAGGIQCYMYENNPKAYLLKSNKNAITVPVQVAKDNIAYAGDDKYNDGCVRKYEITKETWEKIFNESKN